MTETSKTRTQRATCTGGEKAEGEAVSVEAEAAGGASTGTEMIETTMATKVKRRPSPRRKLWKLGLQPTSGELGLAARCLSLEGSWQLP